MIPGPPPVMTAWPRSARIRPTSWATPYHGLSGAVRAEPNTDTAGPIRARASNPSTNSPRMRSARHGSLCRNSGSGRGGRGEQALVGVADRGLGGAARREPAAAVELLHPALPTRRTRASSGRRRARALQRSGGAARRVAGPRRRAERQHHHRALGRLDAEGGGEALRVGDAVGARGDPLGPAGQHHVLGGAAGVEVDQVAAGRDHDRDHQAGVQDVARPVDGVGHGGHRLALGDHEAAGLPVARAARQAPGVQDAQRGLLRHRRAREGRARRACWPPRAGRPWAAG